jgi:hypothetical protein
MFQNMEHSLDVLKNKMPIRRSKNGMLNLMNVPFNPFKMECPKKKLYESANKLI